MPRPIVKRSLVRVRGAWRDHEVRARTAAARAWRAVRLGAVAAHMRSPEVAVVECRQGADVSGLFSEVAAVIGFLDHYDRWQHLYAGVRVDFNDGLYYEPAVGPNWWNYYFEPIEIGDRGAPERVVNPHYHDLCANRVERRLPRHAGAALVGRYVRVTAAVNDIAEAFIRDHWRSAHVIGVHYRGTDKAEDAPRVPYEHMAAVVREAMTGKPESRVFLATDEAAFVDYMDSAFLGRIAYRRMFRSADGRPIDVVNSDGNHQKGLDAVLDCVLLSRTNFLIRTASNLSLCATLFNARLPEMLLNPER